ncbi:putative yippee-like protein Os10g0369500 [Miscanthus floridulus]|uniref:putative yippee-like protein Os10g0369500 n=1 Tax=Miscanthus floridulus TaxID=154761 RepID=UPI00345A5FCD
MGLLFVESLPGPKVFRCKYCRVHSASPDAILSKDFRGRHGRAYLFDSVVNVSLGPNEDRYLMTGLHTVNDIYCSSCQQLLGWRYEKAYNEDQKYKEGKYILEKNMMLKEGW